MEQKVDVKAFVAHKIASQFPGINKERLLQAVNQCADRSLEDMAHRLSSDNCPISLAHK